MIIKPAVRRIRKSAKKVMIGTAKNILMNACLFLTENLFLPGLSPDLRAGGGLVGDTVEVISGAIFSGKVGNITDMTI